MVYVALALVLLSSLAAAIIPVNKAMAATFASENHL